METVVLKGDILYAPARGELRCHKNACLVAEDGRVLGIYDAPPKGLAGAVQDYTGRLIVPGLVDLHTHAPQFAYRGLGLDMQLMQWLNTYAFPTEARFADLDYARAVYTRYAAALAAAGTTRAVVYATQHVPATRLLAEILEEAGLVAYVGKVNMDALSPAYYVEETETSLADTAGWLRAETARRGRVKPILTPRFIPTCSGELLAGLGRLRAETGAPVQSHLSEDLDEMALVKGRYPEFANDAEVFRHFGLLGEGAVMAHFVHATEAEMQLVAAEKTMIAHCPQSNCNVAAGLAPVRRMLEVGVRVGLGSDIAGGHSVSIFRAMGEAVIVSKLRWLESGKRDDFLSVAEAFYLGTKGGGAFFGRAGSFEEGYEFDALVLDDAAFAIPGERFTPAERLGRFMHLADERHIVARFAAGRRVGA